MNNEVLSYEGFVRLVIKALESAGIEYMIGGAVAAWAWGEPRSTLDLDLVIPPGSKGKSKRARPKVSKQLVPQRTKKVPMLPQYEGQFLIDAISSFLEKNVGKTYSVGEIIEQVYGALDDEEIRDMKIRSMVLGELSRGYRIGRFARVPNKLGYYTWDLDAVNV